MFLFYLINPAKERYRLFCILFININHSIHLSTTVQAQTEGSNVQHLIVIIYNEETTERCPEMIVIVKYSGIAFLFYSFTDRCFKLVLLRVALLALSPERLSVTHSHSMKMNVRGPYV